MNDWIDLRSDTVTLPKKEMLDSILQANLGDDILGEDQTVQKLEELAASMYGMEAASSCHFGNNTLRPSLKIAAIRGTEGQGVPLSLPKLFFLL